MSRNKIIIALGALLLIIGIAIVWNKFASTTKIGLINFQQFQTTSIIKANTDNFIEYEEISLDDLDKIKNYDFILGFGMGMNISSEQREIIQSAADKGTPSCLFMRQLIPIIIYVIQTAQKEDITSYLKNGNKKNYLNLHMRQNIDKKTFFVTPADSVVESASDVLYHLDENVSFPTVAEYEQYIRKHNF